MRASAGECGRDAGAALCAQLPATLSVRHHPSPSVTDRARRYETNSDDEPILSSGVVSALATVDLVIIVIFWIEIALKMAGKGLRPWRFFYEGWNIFDFVVILLCVLPGLGSQASLLRLLRLLRVLKLLKMIEQLQVHSSRRQPAPRLRGPRWAPPTLWMGSTSTVACVARLPSTVRSGARVRHRAPAA